MGCMARSSCTHQYPCSLAWARAGLKWSSLGPHAGIMRGWSRPARPVTVARAPRPSVRSAGDCWQCPQRKCIEKKEAHGADNCLGPQEAGKMKWQTSHSTFW